MPVLGILRDNTNKQKTATDTIEEGLETPTAYTNSILDDNVNKLDTFVSVVSKSVSD